MHVVSGVRRQKISVINNHVINLTLHRAKEMMVKMWDMDGLVDHEVIYLAGCRVIISKASANSSMGLSAEGRIITLDNNGSFIVKKNYGITA